MKNTVTGIKFARNTPEYNREYSKLKRTQIYEVNKEYRAKHRAEIKAFNKEWSYKNNLLKKAIIFINLGGYCVCCGNNDWQFLTIDHINGGGKKSKKEHGQGTTYWQYIIDQGIPKDKYQLLCGSCNLAKSDKKNCPHARFNVFDKSTYTI